MRTPHCVGCLLKAIYASRSNVRWRRALLHVDVLRLTGKSSNMIDQNSAIILVYKYYKQQGPIQLGSSKHTQPGYYKHGSSMMPVGCDINYQTPM